MTNYIIIIYGINFKGINKIIIDNIKNILLNNKNNKIIKSIFNNITNLVQTKYNNILYSCIKFKLDLFTIKLQIISNLSNLSYKYKYKFYNALLKKQILYFYNILQKNKN